ncbi:MAG: endonuclease MutS2, partial [Saprospiraceae bacterium]|nr:endonuclease MutS2 [Saprospiraceae bacterium]
MVFEPKDVLKKLEFDKILDILLKEALTSLAIERIEKLSPLTDFTKVDLALRETRDYKLALEKNEKIPLRSFSDIRSELKMLEVPGYTLATEAFQNILNILLVVRDLIKYFSTGAKKEIYPKLYDILRPLTFDEELVAAINKVFDDKGDIRADASPELVRIRRETQQKLKELDGKFRQLMQEYRAKGWLSDSPESFRSGRRVLSVPAEHKRKIRGIIHDESDSGKTAFIEPDGVIEVNNDLFDLEHEEKREVFRILRQLSETIRPYGPQLAQYLEILVRFDVV